MIQVHWDTYHDSCQKTNATAAVSVRYHVTVTNWKERYAYEPHGAEEIAVWIVGVVISAEDGQTVKKASQGGNGNDDA